MKLVVLGFGLAALWLILLAVWINTVSETAGALLRGVWVGGAWLSLAIGIGLLVWAAVHSTREVNR
jgi:hypothetical protein